MNKNKWFMKGGRESGRTFRLLCEIYENKIAELEKENAELEEQCSILADCNTCVSDCKTENIEIKTQLTKAKELLKKLLVHSKRYIWIADDNNKPIMQKEIAEAEQFLNSEVEK